MGSWVNDEIVNVWREIMLNRYNSKNKIWISSTFFFEKLEEWGNAKSGEDKLFERIQKFYKEVLLPLLFE